MKHIFRSMITISLLIFLFTPAVISNTPAIKDQAITVESVQSNNGYNVLFIGSSYFNFNYLPSLFKDLAISSGKEIHVDRIGRNGLYLDDHAASSETELKINERDWDYVVLQGGGTNTAYPEYFSDHPVYPALETLKDKIYQNCNTTKMVFCMPWAFEDGMTWYEDWTDTYEDMQLKIYDTTLQYSNEIGFMVAPVGWSWYSVLEEQNYPLHYLHMSDWNHPSLKGSYLMACTIFSTLFMESSVGLSYDAGLEPEEVHYFQTVASNIVLDDLALWNILDTQIVYVDDDNTDGPWEGTRKHPFQFIQDGINSSSEGDTIMVLEGTYRETITIDKKLTIQGSGCESTIIDGMQLGSTVTILQNHCDLRGFHIINCSLEPLDFTHSLLSIHSSDNCIENNLFSMNASNDFFTIAALQINQGQNNQMLNNEFISDENVSRNYAFFLNGSCENTCFEHNIIHGFYTVFYDSIDTEEVVFKDNQIRDNLFGLRIYGSHCLITRNNISFNRADAIILHGGSGHVIMDNQINDNGYNEGFAAGPGIMLYRSSGGTTIQGNELIHNAGPGVYDYMSFDNQITENNFVNNGWNYEWEEKPNAFFYTDITNIFRTNNWNENYWEPSSSSKWQFIPSELRLFAYFDAVCSLDWFAFDKNPVQEPFEIKLS